MNKNTYALFIVLGKISSIWNERTIQQINKQTCSGKSLENIIKNEKFV